MKHFLSINSCSSQELLELLELSIDLKKLYKSNKRDLCLAGKSLAMIFEKPSLRTRMSFQVAMTNLGGASVYVKPEDVGGIGKREPLKDMARILSGYVDGIMVRTFAHETATGLAEYASVPVINALTDWSHPCQAMADIMTAKEYFGKIEGLKFAFIGDGNNVARSLAFGCAKLGMRIEIASPAGYELDKSSIERANAIKPGTVVQSSDPIQAVKDADIIYTDTWVSMGQEEEKAKRIKDFQGFQVNMDMLKAAGSHVRVMHCLPAYRGYEITDEVCECENSIIFPEAENRLHFQRALLKKLMS